MSIAIPSASQSRKLVPLGSRAFLAYFDDEEAAIHFTRCVREQSWPWLEDVVPAYASVGIFFNPEWIGTSEVRSSLDRMSTASEARHQAGKTHLLPCCYEFQFDMERIREQKGLTAEEVIQLHTSTEFTVYAVGFCPGFPYLGYLPEQLQGVSRLPSPRLRVEAGSVGLTGKQTGLYPLPRPGGWNLIGRTPLRIVEVETNYFPIRVGDRVRFVRIDEQEFRHLEGERL